jgi:hypothetical protein
MKAQRRLRGKALIFLKPRRYLGVGGQRSALASLSQEGEPVPILQEAGWAAGPVWTGAENFSPTEIRTTDIPARSEPLY